MNLKTVLGVMLLSVALFSCEDQSFSGGLRDDYGVKPQLIVRFKFNPDQERLNNIGQPSEVADGNAAQSPIFNLISSHYLELAPNALTALGKGAVLYHAPETTQGGSNAIDFSKSRIVKEGEAFISIPLENIGAGTYEWVRCSLSYQNYDIKVLHANTEYTGTLASFLGFNTYIGEFTSGGYPFTVNANRKQGYWAFGLKDVPFSTSGQAPEGATTVPNPLFDTSPIPAGSCVVTGKFANKLYITGKESKDIVVTLSLSINKSFEWHEVKADGKYEPAAGEVVTDMGLRGLVPSYQ